MKSVHIGYSDQAVEITVSNSEVPAQTTEELPSTEGNINGENLFHPMSLLGITVLKLLHYYTPISN